MLVDQVAVVCGTRKRGQAEGREEVAGGMQQRRAWSTGPKDGGCWLTTQGRQRPRAAPFPYCSRQHSLPALPPLPPCLTRYRELDAGVVCEEVRLGGAASCQVALVLQAIMQAVPGGEAVQAEAGGAVTRASQSHDPPSYHPVVDRSPHRHHDSLWERSSPTHTRAPHQDPPPGPPPPP